MKFPTSKSLKKETCQICLHNLINASLQRCGHKFCKSCIMKSIQSKNVCPLCHQAILEVRHQGKSFSIKKKRLMSWKPHSNAPEITLIFNGNHEQIFQQNMSELHPILQSFAQKVVSMSVEDFQIPMVKIEDAKQ